MPGRRPQPGLPPRFPKHLRTAWLLLLLGSEPSYGYVLRAALRAHGHEIDPGALYRSLRELEGAGLVVSHWMAPAGGPRTRVYTLTPAGAGELERIAMAIERSRDEQSAFIETYDRLRPDPSA